MSARPDEQGTPAVPQPLRVVLVDDHRLVRSGVRAELDRQPPAAGLRPIAVVGEAGTVEEAAEVVARETPEVVLLDVHLPGGQGGGGAEVLRRTAGTTTPDGTPVRALALSVSDAAADVIAVIRAGARGYVTKTVDGPALADAVRRVADGDAVFSPRLAGFVLDAFGPATAPEPVPADPSGTAHPGTGHARPPAPAAGVPAVDEELDRLTARERQVMRLIARGYAYREVGKELFISARTVETHVSSVLRKLQLSNRHELTRWAVDRRLL